MIQRPHGDSRRLRCAATHGGLGLGRCLDRGPYARSQLSKPAAEFLARRAGALGLGGHHVRVASNGAEAVRCFEKLKYDLSFIDVRMPVMNGVDCFFAIRARYPDAKIVLMTGLKEPAVAKALNAGALALLHKPFRMEEVMKIARQYQ